MVFSIRQAVERDVASISAIDLIAQAEAGRRRFIERAVAEGSCFVIALDDGDAVIAYGVLEYSFYGYGFISMLYVEASQRRRNYGTALMNHLERVCRTEKLFTSTNLSNLAMQSLLAKAGYKLSGVIHNLDEDDPELVYCKARLSSGPVK